MPLHDSEADHKPEKWAIPTQEVNDFLAQAPPRIASHGIRRNAYGFTRFGMYFGAGFLFVGGFFFCVTAIVGIEVIGGRDGPMPRGPASFLLMIVSLMGGVVLFFNARRRWRVRRILRDGICEQAKVVKVRASIIQGNGNTLHYVTFETDSGRVELATNPGPASLARTLQERGETVRLLVDPQNQSRALWIGSYSLDAYE